MPLRQSRNPPCLVVLLLAFLFASSPASLLAENYAFLVAVSSYEGTELNLFRFGRSDINDFRKSLIDSGFKPDNVVLLVDNPEPGKEERFAPRAKNIRDEFAKLVGRLTKDDALVVGLAGHGIQFRGESECWFCPADAKLSDRGTLIAVSGLLKQMKDCKAERTLLLADVCRSDAQTEASREAVACEAIAQPQDLEVPDGVAALFSCAAGQQSFEDPDSKRGLFFRYVAKGWSGAADADSDKQLTLDELESYVGSEVAEYARETLKAAQTPVLKGEPPDDWILNGTGTRPKPVAGKTSKKPAKPGKLPGAPKVGAEWDGNGLKMVFCGCPDGTFTMGSPKNEAERSLDEEQAQVSLTGFWLAKCEVNQSDWMTVMGTTLPAQHAKAADASVKVVATADDLPMSFVSYLEATAFCRKLTTQERAARRLPVGWEFALPTEAQWEYACRAGTKGRFSLDADGSTLGDVAWYQGNAASKAHPVGTKKPNAWGLCDMHGNVWEWTRDAYRARLPGGRDPIPLDQNPKAVFRGGSWWDGESFCRSAFRRNHPADTRDGNLGFRIALVRAGK